MKRQPQSRKGKARGKQAAGQWNGEPRRTASAVTSKPAAIPTPAQPGKNRSKSAAKPKPSGARTDDSASHGGSKKAAIIALLRRAGGATLTALMKETGWQPHSLRGFISGTLRNRMGLKIKFSKAADGERTYQLKA